MRIQCRPNADTATDLLGIAVFDHQLPAAGAPDGPLSALDTALGGLLLRSIADERFRAKPAQLLSIQTGERGPARRIALLGMGSRADGAPAVLQNAAAQLARHALAVGARDIVFTAAEEARGEADVRAWLAAAALGVTLGAYRFDKYLTVDPARGPGIEAAWLSPPGLAALTDSEQSAAVARALRTADAVAFARDLVNEPAGELTPTRIAEQCTARATAAGATATVLSAGECRALGMGLFLAVAQGSEQEPRFVHLAWTPPVTEARPGPFRRIVLVGKGVTFDSGGLSLKTTEGMLEMKTDMAGAAAVLAALPVVAQENLPIEVHALAACTENMISARAYKLGDVLRSMAGKTVEINNTDAEGRLTLADALTYGLRLHPDVILDFATLTGACIVALGPHVAGVMSNHEDARRIWLEAAQAAGEEMWPLPLPARLGEQLKSEIADLRNTGERWGGALTAGLFLKEFVGATPWIHVDLAGPSTASKEWGTATKGATGFGVASILQYLRTVAAEPPTGNLSSRGRAV
jgi:leucyl aminopeptidase